MRTVNNQTVWAKTLLKQLGIHPSHGSVKALVGWANAEGGHWNNSASYNPLNTTYKLSGSHVMGGGNSSGVQAYRNWRQGLEATVKTLRNYPGVLNALRAGDPGAVADAVGSSPWGTNASLVRSAIASAKVGHGHAVNIGGGGGGHRGVPTTSGTLGTLGTLGSGQSGQSGGVDPQARQALLLNYVENRDNPDALLNLAFGLRGLDSNSTTAPSRAPHGRSSTPHAASRAQSSQGGTGRRMPSKGLYELFWQGQGGIDVKYGQVEPQGFVSGHTDHVHVAANRKEVVRLGKLAERMGLHVGENPHFGGVHPVHVANSFHYKGEAIDVSGDPARMRKFAHTVARKYGVR